MSMKNTLIALFICCLYFGVSYAETKIRAEVDKASITTGQALLYRVTVTTDEGAIGQPKFPEFKHFFVLSRSQSSSVVFSQKGAQSVFVYTFALAPDSPGKFTIEPCRTESKGNKYESEQVEVEVLQGKAPSGKSVLEPRISPPESKEPQVTL